MFTAGQARHIWGLERSVADTPNKGLAYRTGMMGGQDAIRHPSLVHPEHKWILFDGLLKSSLTSILVG